MRTMGQGMAFGAGSEVAHQAFRGVMGGNSQSHATEELEKGEKGEKVQYEVACLQENNNFVECLKFNPNEIARCQDLFIAIQNCRSKF